MAFPVSRSLSMWKNRSEYSFNGPIVSQSPIDNSSVQADDATPFRDGVRFTVPRQLCARGRIAIVRLFSPCRPTYVAGLIVPVFVRPAIQRVFHRRPQTDISKEIQKRFTPVRTDEHTSATVPSIGWMLRVFAALDHHQPHDVFRRAVLAVFCDSARRVLAGIAAARSCVVRDQIGVQHGFSVPHAHLQIHRARLCGGFGVSGARTVNRPKMRPIRFSTCPAMR